MNRFSLSIPALLCALPCHAQRLIVCVDPVLTIPELAPATLIPIEVDLPAGATVDAVSVSIGLTHPWVGDLVIALTKDADQAILLDRLSLGVYPFGCGGKNIDAVFIDSASTTPESLCEPGPAPVITGDVLPNTPLAVFAGAEAGGTWTLSILDQQHFDLGQIDRVCLTVDYTAATPPCSPADIAEPFGLLNDLDVTTYLGRFENLDPTADLAAPLGTFDFFDVLMYLSLFDQGCEGQASTDPSLIVDHKAR